MTPLGISEQPEDPSVLKRGYKQFQVLYLT